jgi:methylmalonyl-CoA mutase C-terminal domain/subunit
MSLATTAGDVDRRGQIKVLLAKTGMDGHDRGIKVLAKGLMQEGIEVIYLGAHQSEEAVTQAALDEDVDVVGISTLAGEHMSLVPKLAESLSEAGLDDLIFIVGGVIPRQHIPKLKELGVDEVFEAATMVKDIAEWIKNEVQKRRPDAAADDMFLRDAHDLAATSNDGGSK